ncbi:hypothetical protein [Celeribacter neptunius]|uniref:hypothetical protein n=1 Tax=Celeribacter neptunius TaxID=588602 RepID=UPI0015A619BB|nr:hypothetical protein [Celeribacter neptunius]
MGANEKKQTELEERIVERLLVDRQAPVDVLRDVMAGPDAPDPLEAVFALTTVASDMSTWHEEDLRELSEHCFQDAALFICELWAAGYELKAPEGVRRAMPSPASDPDQSFSSTTEPTE